MKALESAAIMVGHSIRWKCQLALNSIAGRYAPPCRIRKDRLRPGTSRSGANLDSKAIRYFLHARSYTILLLHPGTSFREAMRQELET
jgi:hypothetical protein